MSEGQERSAIVVGAGNATGGAVARRFARGGYVVCPVRRTAEAAQVLADEIVAAGHGARAFGVDARDEGQVVALFEQVEREVAPVEVVVFNAGTFAISKIRDTSADLYRDVWELGAFAGFLVGREAARLMVPRGKGTILFTGASASVRGSAGFSAFAGGKFALRALAQSMARELGPQGIHVAHIVIDGMIDTEQLAANFPDRDALKAQDALLDPESIAETYWQLHCQHRTAWTHEIDVRPYVEKF